MTISIDEIKENGEVHHEFEKGRKRCVPHPTLLYSSHPPVPFWYIAGPTRRLRSRFDGLRGTPYSLLSALVRKKVEVEDPLIFLNIRLLIHLFAREAARRLKH